MSTEPKLPPDQHRPADLPRPAFLSEEDWAALDQPAQLFWHQFEKDVNWLAQQPQFRRFLFAWLDEPRFCGANASTHRREAVDRDYANGRRDAGLAMQRVVQAVAPNMWMRLLREGFNARSAIPLLNDEEM